MPLEILLVGPLLALAVLALIAVAADASTMRRRPATTEGDDDFGLLRTVAIASDFVMARAVRERLMSVGIRSTVGVDRDGMHLVLVFDDEYERARDAV